MVGLDNGLPVLLSVYNVLASLSDINALREDVMQLMELIQKLIIEFKAVKREVEASHLDIMDSMQVALTACIQSRSINS